MSDQSDNNPLATVAAANMSPTRFELKFLMLPAEIRCKIYEYILTCKGTISTVYHGKLRTRPRFKFDTLPDMGFECDLLISREYRLAANILLTNSFILHEARRFLYAHNTFEIICGEPRDSSRTCHRVLYAKYFFEEIGRENASLIRHLRMEFPRFWVNLSEWNCDADTVPRIIPTSWWHMELRFDSEKLFCCLENYCKNIQTVTITFRSMWELEGYWTEKFSATCLASFFGNVFRMYNSCFKCFPRLRKKLIEVRYDDHDGFGSPNDRSRAIRDVMRDYGWVETVQVEEGLYFV